MLAALSPDMLATDLAYYLARKGVCTPIFEWVTLRKRIKRRLFWICVWGSLGRGNHVITITITWRHCVFKIFSVRTKMQNWHFYVPPVWRAPCSVRRNNAEFQISSALCGTGLRSLSTQDMTNQSANFTDDKNVSRSPRTCMMYLWKT